MSTEKPITEIVQAELTRGIAAAAHKKMLSDSFDSGFRMGVCVMILVVCGFYIASQY